MKSEIIEECENLQLQRIATVKGKRGEEFTVNVDQAICALADLFSDLANEKRNGWSLSAQWFSNEINRLYQKACS